MYICIHNMVIKQSSCIIFQSIIIYESLNCYSLITFIKKKLYCSLSIINKLKYK